MTTEERVAREINEIPSTIHIGDKEFKVRPLTFGQIIDASTIVSNMREVVPDDGEDIITANFKHTDDIEKMIDVAMIILFRNPEERTDKMRKFLRNNLTEENYTPLQEMYIERLETGFFLNTIIFLKKYLNVTKPTKVIPPGPSGTEQ